MIAFAIRPFRPSDGAALADLHRRAIFAISSYFYDDAQKRSWAHGLTPEGYQQQPGVIEVAVDPADLAVGFCQTVGAEILGLYVHPDWQRAGIGFAFLPRAEARIAAAGHDSAQVKATLSARPFYERHGFEVTGLAETTTRGGLMIPCVALEKSIVISR